MNFRAINIRLLSKLVLCARMVRDTRPMDSLLTTSANKNPLVLRKCVALSRRIRVGFGKSSISLFIFLTVLSFQLSAMEKNDWDFVCNQDISMPISMRVTQEEYQIPLTFIRNHNVECLIFWLADNKQNINKEFSVKITWGSWPSYRTSCTLLHYASACGNPEIIQSLVTHGAVRTSLRINRQNKDYYLTPLGVACIFNQHKNVVWFDSHYEELNTGNTFNERNTMCSINLFCLASECGCLEILQRISDIHPWIIREHGANAFDLAAGMKNWSIVSFLIQKGVPFDIDTKIDGKSLMEIAFEQKDTKLIALLKNKGASIDQIPLGGDLQDDNEENCIIS